MAYYGCRIKYSIKNSELKVLQFPSDYLDFFLGVFRILKAKGQSAVFRAFGGLARVTVFALVLLVIRCRVCRLGIGWLGVISWHW
jgi:hypothetical protein